MIFNIVIAILYIFTNFYYSSEIPKSPFTQTYYTNYPSTLKYTHYFFFPKRMCLCILQVFPQWAVKYNAHFPRLLMIHNLFLVTIIQPKEFQVRNRRALCLTNHLSDLYLCILKDKDKQFLNRSTIRICANSWTKMSFKKDNKKIILYFLDWWHIAQETSFTLNNNPLGKTQR